MALGASIGLSSGFTGTTLALAKALTTPVVGGPSVPADLVAVYRRSPAGEYLTATGTDLDAVGAERQTVSSAGGAAMARIATIRAGTALFEARISTVHRELFETLAMVPSEGRLLMAADATAVGPLPMVVSRSFWTRSLGIDHRVGDVVTLDGVEHVLVGVAPDGFDGFELGRPTEAWIPAVGNDDGSRVGDLTIVARLQRGRSVADLQRALPALAPMPFAQVDPAYRERLRPIALALLLAGVMVLAAGFVSVAALLISRNAQRLDEIGARAALGATAARLRAQLAIESAFLAAAACGGAAPFAWWTLRLLFSTLAPEQAAVLRVHMGLPLLLAMSASSLLIWIPVCLACAHYVAKATPALLQRSVGSLRDNPIGLSVQRRLLVAQTALACALLIAVTLLGRGFDAVLTSGLGRAAGRVAIMSMLSAGGYGDAVRGTRFQRIALDRVNRMPGVLAAAWATTLPLVEGPRSDFSTSPTGALAGYRTILVSTSYFRTMQLDVIAGRSFEREEEVAYAPAVMINAALAARLFPDGLSGARLFEKDGSVHPVVGVASDGRYRQMEGYAEPTVYRPMSIEYTAFLHLLVRGTSDASTLLPAIRATLDGIDQAAISREERLEQHVAGELGRDRVAVVLVEACGLLVMLLSLSGAYLLAASLAARRRHEMAVRLALGSTRLGLVLAMVERTLAPTVVGVALGAVCAYAATPALRSLLGTLSMSDALLFGEVAVVVVVLSLAATAIPALAAARSISPIAALR